MTDTALLERLLSRSAAWHQTLCPRQVLGVRMGMLAGRLLELQVPRNDKRLFVFMETDGCSADGVSVATGCRVGHRTMRIVDMGKVAATFVDTASGRAVRLHPHPEARRLAVGMFPEAESHWHAQRMAYKVMEDRDLLVAQHVVLGVDLERIVSAPDHRALCDACGEEVFNQREVHMQGRTLCRSCAGNPYYRSATDLPIPPDGPSPRER